MRARSLLLIGVPLCLAFALGRDGRRAQGAPVAASAPTASTNPAWIDTGDVPLPDWAKSVEVLREDEALFVAPGGTRRGLVAAGVRLPLLGAVRAAGCTSRWILVGPLAYVCQDKVKFSPDPAGVEASVHPVPADALPYRYYFVGKDGGDAFAKLSDADDETPAEQLERGWSIAGVAEVMHKGATYVVTRKGRYIPRAQLGQVTAYAFQGEALTTDATSPIAVGWILVDKTNVLAEPKPNAKVVGARTRLQKIDVLETKKVMNVAYARIAENAWIRAIDARIPTRAARPEEALPESRWIDVDTSTQTLVAYEGDKPVFATMASTGRVGTPTPKGVYKIWVKLRSATMSNADDSQTTTDDATPFSIEDVPWVQYFSNGVAIHGAFWHRKFGHAHSHGCVNLAPLDAMRIFDWTVPRLPRGWDAVFPTTAEPATVIRVR